MALVKCSGCIACKKQTTLDFASSVTSKRNGKALVSPNFDRKTRSSTTDKKTHVARETSAWCPACWVPDSTIRLKFWCTTGRRSTWHPHLLTSKQHWGQVFTLCKGNFSKFRVPKNNLLGTFLDLKWQVLIFEVLNSRWIWTETGGSSVLPRMQKIWLQFISPNFTWRPLHSAYTSTMASSVLLCRAI